MADHNLFIVKDGSMLSLIICFTRNEGYKYTGAHWFFYKEGTFNLLDLMLWLLEFHWQTSLFGFKDKSPHSHGLLLEPSLFNMGRNFWWGLWMKRCLNNGGPQHLNWWLGFVVITFSRWFYVLRVQELKNKIANPTSWDL